MPRKSHPIRASALFIVALMVAAGLPIGAAQSDATYFEETWDDPTLPGWTTSGFHVGPDCVVAYAICSLIIDSQAEGETVQAQRQIDLSLEGPGYVVSFLYRNDWAYSLSKSWFTMHFADGGHVKIDLTYGAPHNRLALFTERAATGDFFTYSHKEWYLLVLKFDLENNKVHAEVREPSGALLGSSKSLAIRSTASQIALVSFEGYYYGRDPLNQAPQPMNIDNFRITRNDPPAEPSLLGSVEDLLGIKIPPA